MSELIFPASFEAHLDSINNEPEALRWRPLHVNKNELKYALSICYGMGISKLTMEVSGSGDSGDGAYITEVVPQEMSEKIPKHVEKILLDYLYAVAEYFNPGYYNNDGGGYECVIEFSPFKMSGYPYYFETIRREGEIFIAE